MLSRLAVICNFSLGTLKMDHCQKGRGWGRVAATDTHSAALLQNQSGPVVTGMNEVPEGLVAMA